MRNRNREIDRIRKNVLDTSDISDDVIYVAPGEKLNFNDTTTALHIWEGRIVTLTACGDCHAV